MDTKAYERAHDVYGFKLGMKVQRYRFCCIWPIDTVSSTREQKDALGRIWIVLVIACLAATICLFQDANARAGEPIGEEGCKVIGAYGSDTRDSDSNGTSLLRFAGDINLALVNTFSSVPEECTSRTFNGNRPADRKHLDYIIT